VETTKKGCECHATLSIRVKKNTVNVRKADEFVRRGLFAIVTIANRHSHLIENAEALKWLG